MKTTILSGLVCLFALASLAAPPSADEIMTKAKIKAAAEQKAMFVHFGASWCGWCKKLDAFLESPPTKSVFEKYFVPIKLIVQENEMNKPLENPGADNFQKVLGGPAGLPYSAFLDKEGKLIVSSKRNGEEGQNIGFPSEPKEVDWFLAMMRKAAPGISESDLKSLEATLRAPKK